MSLKDVSQQDKAKISGYLRGRSIREYPMITLVNRASTEASEDIPVVVIDDVLKIGFPRTVSERLDRALENIHRLSHHLGFEISLDPKRDYPVLFAENESAFHFIAETLQEAGWVKLSKIFGAAGITLTARGWNRMAELERGDIGKDSRQAFVAMWLDESLRKPYKEGIERAIKDAGYQPLRVDLIEHNEKICDAIIAEIRKSRFMVADFTGYREGVYFEAGFARGLGIEVISTVREDDLDKTHFDTRQYNHIVWKSEEDLYEKLRRRIEATIVR